MLPIFDHFSDSSTVFTSNSRIQFPYIMRDTIAKAPFNVDSINATTVQNALIAALQRQTTNRSIILLVTDLVSNTTDALDLQLALLIQQKRAQIQILNINNVVVNPLLQKIATLSGGHLIYSTDVVQSTKVSNRVCSMIH